jgi:hypothetical protein
VASKVTSNYPIVAERSVYFDHGGYNGGHCAMGAEAPQKDWYFAEGCTQPGFQEWLCILNPNGYGVSVNVAYFIEGSGTPTYETLYIPPNTRYTRNVPDLLGTGKNVSVKISGAMSSDTTVCERPMYFKYQGKWNGGHIAMGVNQLSKTWLFAEGCTRPGFETWLTIQNPNNGVATVSTTYMTGTGENIKRIYSVPANTRRTISVGGEIGLDKDVSIAVDSDLSVACERPMYFNYHDKWDGGSDSFGSLAPQTTLLFAEGCSRPNFETWLCIQNPNPQGTDVTVSFYKETGEEQQYNATIPANTRTTINANDIVGPGHDFSIKVNSNSGVVAERPMYFDYQGKAPTPEPTPPPTPIQTPPPPPPPPPTPSPTPTGAVNVIAQKDWTDSVNGYWIYGVVQNNTSQSVSFVKITAAAYSSGGTLLDTSFSYADLYVLDNGDKSGFSVLFYPKPPGTASYKITNVEWDASSTPRNRDVVVTSKNAYHASGYYHLAGELKNNSTSNTHEYVLMSIAFYDSSGGLVMTDFAYADSDTIGPGSTSTFSIMEDESRHGQISSSEIWVGCQD